MGSDHSAKLWTAWLPADLREQVITEEPKRFSRAVALLVEAIAAAKASPDPDSLASTLVWIDVIKRWVG